MRLLLSSLLVFCVQLVQAQTCNCTKIFDSVQLYMTKNYAGFADKTNTGNEQIFLTHTSQMRSLSQTATTTPQCFYVINKWLSFFKDQHVYLNTTPNADTISLSKAELSRLQRSNPDSIEGIYYYGTDSIYKVAVVKNKKGLRSYAGVIVASKAPTWKRGELKFELILNSDGHYDMNLFNRNHEVTPGQLDPDWVKAGVARASITNVPSALFKEEENHTVFFKQIDSATGYLRVQSFDGAYYRKIDSVVYTNKSLIQRLPRLVIDVRGNGGGSDRSKKALQEIIYTQPVKDIGNDIWATPENVLAWEILIRKYRGKLPDDHLNRLQRKIDKTKGVNGFMNFNDDVTYTVAETWPQPQKVAILIDKGCGSSTEEFLLEALQSKKVILAGTPSAGVLDYSNVVAKEFACPNFELHYPTTRSRRIDLGQGIDNKGIQPNMPLDFNKAGWFQELLARW
jgi:hypothetical protein